jgi:hypothetical protein
MGNTNYTNGTAIVNSGIGFFKNFLPPSPAAAEPNMSPPIRFLIDNRRHNLKQFGLLAIQ